MSTAQQCTATGENNTHEIPAKPWEVVGTSIFMVNIETLLCIVDYYSKFPAVKNVESMLAEGLI